MTVSCNLLNGGSVVIKLIGDMNKITKFIENFDPKNHNGVDLGNAIICEDFVEDFIELSEIEY